MGETCGTLEMWRRGGGRLELEAERIERYFSLSSISDHLGTRIGLSNSL